MNNEIMFPYFKDGEIVNIKYRTLDKEYRQEKDAEKVFYGLDDIHGEDAIYIVEGEMDKLALEVAGIRMFYPFLMEHLLLDQGVYETKFKYIEDCEEQLKDIKKIVMAVDNDAAGRKLESGYNRTDLRKIFTYKDILRSLQKTSNNKYLVYCRHYPE